MTGADRTTGKVVSLAAPEHRLRLLSPPPTKHATNDGANRLLLSGESGFTAASSAGACMRVMAADEGDDISDQRYGPLRDGDRAEAEPAGILELVCGEG